MAALDRIRDEMAKNGNAQIEFIGEGLTVLLQRHPEAEPALDDSKKSLSGCLDAIRKAAKGGVCGPIQATQAICHYYGLPFTDFRRLAAEINGALCGVESAEARHAPQTPAPAPAQASTDFDLDALLEGL